MRKPKTSNDLFITSDGDWSVGGTRFDTRFWEAEHWDRLDAASLAERLTVALLIDREIRRDVRRAQRLIAGAEAMSVRTFIVDEDGVEEI